MHLNCQSLTCSALFLLVAQSPKAPVPDESNVMVVAVSRDDSMIAGGIGTGSNTSPGKINLEILALLSSSGEWRNHPCARTYSRQCDAFAREYLSKSHTYVVVSADGRGDKIHSEPVRLSEC